VSVTLEHSPAGRSKAGIAVSFDADPRLASLIIWDTGETELDLADLHRRAHHATPRHQLAHRGRPDRYLDQPRRAIAAQLHNDPGLVYKAADNQRNTESEVESEHEMGDAGFRGSVDHPGSYRTKGLHHGLKVEPLRGSPTDAPTVPEASGLNEVGSGPGIPGFVGWSRSACVAAGCPDCGSHRHRGPAGAAAGPGGGGL
jgi:hypothetical protein